MASKPIRPVYQQIFTLGLALALAVVLGGSYLALNQSAGLASIGEKLWGSIAQLTNNNLIVKADRTRLAANGISQTTIIATHPSPPTPITARIVSGSGVIHKVSEQKDQAKFTYTAGSVIGMVEIEFASGQMVAVTELELVAATPPEAPQLLSPPTNSTGSQLRPEIIGTGPANTRIAISANGQINTTTRSDINGSFRVRLEKALGGGQQNITAIAINDLDIPSQPSNALVINIQPQPMTYDAQHVRFSPDRIIAGDSFAVFIPASLNTEKVQVIFNDTTYELNDPNGSSIFSRTLPAPREPGSYTATVVLIDGANNQARFDNVLRFSVNSC